MPFLIEEPMVVQSPGMNWREPNNKPPPASIGDHTFAEHFVMMIVGLHFMRHNSAVINTLYVVFFLFFPT